MGNICADIVKARNQILASVIVSLGYFSVGLVRAWSSPAIPSLNDVNGSYALSIAPLTDEQISWLSGLGPLGALFGGLLSGPFLQRIGRKFTLMIGALFFTGAFLLLGSGSITDSLESMYAARLIMGVLGVGMSMSSAQIYVSECSEARIRGILGSFPAIFMALGILAVYIVGAFLPWHILSYFCAAIPFVLFVCLIFLPKSPIWLLGKGREEEARKALSWFRPGQNVQKEFDALREETCARSQTETDRSSIWIELRSRRVLFPFFLALSLLGFQQWCGVNVVIFYTVIIFEASGSGVDQNLATIIVGIVQFVATLASITLVDKAGRRILLLVSGSIMTVSLSAMGAFFYIKVNAPESASSLGWLPLVSLMVFMIGYSVGFASIPFILMGELFPNQFRNLLGSVASSWNLLHTFLSIKLFVDMKASVEMFGCFWIYAGFSFLSVVFVFFLLPETKGKTLSEIEDLFKSKKEREIPAI